jgi:hypothetical protein
MDVGTSSVIGIWISFLWPVLVTSLFAISKNSAVRKGGYFAQSLVGGYVSMFVGNFLTVGFSKIITSSYFLDESGYLFEKYFNSSVMALMALFMVLPPIFVAFYVSRKPQ